MNKKWYQNFEKTMKMVMKTFCIFVENLHIKAIIMKLKIKG